MAFFVIFTAITRLKCKNKIRLEKLRKKKQSGIFKNYNHTDDTTALATAVIQNYFKHI